MRKYRFVLIESNLEGFVEREHVYLADSIAGALRKFSRQHELEPPAYWDEPAFDRYIEVNFKSSEGAVRYKISW